MTEEIIALAESLALLVLQFVKDIEAKDSAAVEANLETARNQALSVQAKIAAAETARASQTTSDIDSKIASFSGPTVISADAVTTHAAPGVAVPVVTPATIASAATQATAPLAPAPVVEPEAIIAPTEPMKP